MHKFIYMKIPLADWLKMTIQAMNKTRVVVIVS